MDKSLRHVALSPPGFRLNTILRQMRHFSHFNTAKQILSLYRGEQPFVHFIKDYFKGEKKYGSKDRKRISHLCYCYFRLGKIWIERTVDDRVLLGLFLVQNSPDELLQDLKPDWNASVSLPFVRKLELLNDEHLWKEIFPHIELINETIHKKEFALSHLIQPDLFLRVRPGYKKRVVEKLEEQKISYREIDESTLALPNASRLEAVLDNNRETVVQDLSSQRVGGLIKEVLELPENRQRKFKVWDCCAASGGKSIMTYDIAGNIDLTVSDIRQNILINLKKRFSEAGITKYKDHVINLGNEDRQAERFIHNEKFDLVIADVPCTGSGTWGRTPEQLTFFKTSLIEEYTAKQRKIVSHTIPFIRQNGYLLYITCSVYRKENEDNVQFISSMHGMELIRMELFQGFQEKADTLFAAIFKRTIT